MMLADLGAEVTKVERPGVGDETRSWGPPYDERGEATYFQSVNRNKSSLVLDLGDAGDLDEIRRLAREADVLVENFRPGLMAELRPRLRGPAGRATRASSTARSPASARGERGAALPGYDLLIQALGGLMSITGEPEGEPTKVGVALVDVLAGLFATVGILAALEHRRDGGEGQLVEVDLYSSLLAALVNQGSAYTLAGAVPGRMGNRHPSISPYELFRTGDGRAGAGGRQRSPVRGSLRDDRDARAGRRPALRDQPRPGREPRGPGRAARGRARRPAGRRVGGRADRAPRSRRGRQRRRRAPSSWRVEIGLEPTVAIPREDGSSVELTRNPIRLSATPASYRLPPPALSD